MNRWLSVCSFQQRKMARRRSREMAMEEFIKLPGRPFKSSSPIYIVSGATRERDWSYDAGAGRRRDDCVQYTPNPNSTIRYRIRIPVHPVINTGTIRGRMSDAHGSRRAGFDKRASQLANNGIFYCYEFSRENSATIFKMESIIAAASCSVCRIRKFTSIFSPSRSSRRP